MIMVFENSSKININKDQMAKLSEFAKIIFSTNKNFNLTGLKTMEDIIKNPIIGAFAIFGFVALISSSNTAPTVVQKLNKFGLLILQVQKDLII